MKSKKIVVFGSYVADLTGTSDRLPKAAETVFGDEFQIGPGGKGSNQAVAAHRTGANVTLVTKIGCDVFGEQAIQFYKDQKIAADYILEDEIIGTGVALICVDRLTGQNQILVIPGACTHFTEDDIEKLTPLICEADVLLVQFEVNMDALERVIDIAHQKGVKVLLNPAPARKASQEMLSKVDIILPNEVEAEEFTGVHVHDEQSAERAAKVFHEWGIPIVVITMGSKGVFASDGKNSKMIPARMVKAVDTTGAGDAFCGGFATAYCEGNSLFESIEFGNAVASLSVQKLGTAPSMPMRRDVDEIFDVSRKDK